MGRFLAVIALPLMVTAWMPRRCESFEFQNLNFQRNGRCRPRIEAHSQPDQQQQEAADHGPTSSPSHTDNKAMAFLKKIGKVGGAANKDYRFAMGVDEGPVGKATSGSASAASTTLRKVKQAYRSCDISGVVDDLTEAFPFTSSGTKWSSVTDRVMGGQSSGKVTREESFHGRTANVLRGNVALLNNDGNAAGFVQMATNLAIVDADGVQTVDASKYDGVELTASCETANDQNAERFNIHLKTTACAMPFSSYRASFTVPNENWATIRIPWSEFEGHGPGARDAPFDSSHLVRAGIVAIGREMDVTLGVSSIRFYKKETLRP